MRFHRPFTTALATDPRAVAFPTTASNWLMEPDLMDGLFFPRSMLSSPSSFFFWDEPAVHRHFFGVVEDPWSGMERRTGQNNEKEANDETNENTQQQQQHLSYRPFSSQYEVVSNDEKTFAVAVSVPKGIDAKDVDVSLDQRNRSLTISGSHESKTNHGHFSTSFRQSFSLDPSVELDKLDAKFDENGRLLVSAPKDTERIEATTIRKIPIASTPNAAAAAATDEVVNSATTKTAASSADDDAQMKQSTQQSDSSTHVHDAEIESKEKHA
mmetsp:Transcript_16936/g.47527  ORF Transcript_16936/g.47527 Transcript_16936/m.47527 type:complete len:270 (-) Transcript_16936:136-945(-)